MSSPARLFLHHLTDDQAVEFCSDEWRAAARPAGSGQRPCGELARLAAGGGGMSVAHAFADRPRRRAAVGRTGVHAGGGAATSPTGPACQRATVSRRWPFRFLLTWDRAIRMSFAILGMGTALPPTRLSKSEAERVARAMCCSTPEHAELVAALYRQAGIDSRHVLFDRGGRPRRARRHPAHRLAVSAGRRGQSRARRPAVRMKTYEEHASAVGRCERPKRRWPMPSIDPSAITHVVTVSCTGFARAGRGHRPDQAARPAADDRANARRLHGLSRGDRTGCGSPGPSPTPTRPRGCSSARSSCAACTTTTAGIRSGWWPTPCSPTGPRPSSAGGRSRPANLAGLGDRLVPVSGQRIRDDLARRRSRLRHDALDPGAEPDRRQPAAVAGALAAADHGLQHSRTWRRGRFIRAARAC